MGYAHFLVEITNASDIATVQRIAGIRKFEISSNLLSGSVTAEAEYSGLLRYISAGVWEGMVEHPVFNHVCSTVYVGTCSTVYVGTYTVKPCYNEPWIQ